MGWRTTTIVRESGVSKRDLDIPISDTLHTVLGKLADRGHKALVVGGAVRDAMMGEQPKDIDVEVYGTHYDALNDILSQHGKTNLVGKAFGVVKFTDQESNDYDFSLPRRDNKSGIGHKDFEVSFDPEITPQEAASRRDFTFNSMAYDPINKELHDYHGGEEDLKNKVIRHTSDAFAEDPLRVLRGMQFAARFGMEVAPETAELAKSISHEYSTIPKERVSEEFMKLAAKGKEPGRAVDYLHKTGWSENFPALHALHGVEQDEQWHPEGDVAAHTAHAMNAAAKIADREGLKGDDRAVAVFGAMAHDFGKATHTQTDGPRITSHGHDQAGGPIAREFLDQIGIKSDISDKVQPLVENHMQHLNFENGISPRTVRRLSQRLKPANIRELSYVMEADHSGRPPLEGGLPKGAQNMLEAAETSHVTEKPMERFIEGRDIMPYFNNEPGPHIGEHVKAAYEAQLNGEINSPEEAQQWLKNRFSKTARIANAPTCNNCGADNVPLLKEPSLNVQEPDGEPIPGTEGKWLCMDCVEQLLPKTSSDIRIAMPRDDEFIGRLRFEHKIVGHDGPVTNHSLNAWHGSDAVGNILWSDAPDGICTRCTHKAGSHDELGCAGDGGCDCNDDGGEMYGPYVTSLDVVHKYQRHGVATEMWNKAKEIQPNLQHDYDEMLTDDGWNWVNSLEKEGSRDDDFLSSLSWEEKGNIEKEPVLWTKGLIARHPEGHVVGYIGWWPDYPDTERIEVSSLLVHPDHRHKGLATELWNRAKAIEPRLQHSTEQTEDGKRWVQSLGDKPSTEPSLEALDWPKEWKASQSVRISMPRDDEFIKSLKFIGPMVSDGGGGTIYHLGAETSEGESVGEIHWNKADEGHCSRCFHPDDQHDEYGCAECQCFDDGGYQDWPYVAGIDVEGKYQRHGVASELWRRARQFEPELEHDWGHQTEEGNAWAKKVGWKNNKETFYHVSDPELRESIRENGLKATYNNSVYLVPDPEVVPFVDYKRPEHDADIWEVHADPRRVFDDEENENEKCEGCEGKNYDEISGSCFENGHVGQWFRHEGDIAPEDIQLHTSLEKRGWKSIAIAPRRPYYHVAPSDSEDSILHQGIDHTQGESPWGGVTVPGNYLYGDEQDAEDYAETQTDRGVPQDIWKVDALGLSDLDRDPEDIGGGWDKNPYGSGEQSFIVDCPYCGGEGRTSDDEKDICDRCNGQGIVDPDRWKTDTPIEPDRLERIGSWKDVRNKAVRLRNANLVNIILMDDNVIAADVTGDHHTYHVVLYRQYPDSMAITMWECSCKWGDWAFKRQVTYVGRMCSHALATLYEAQSPKWNQRSAALTQKEMLKQVGSIEEKWGPDESEVLHTFDDGWTIRRIKRVEDKEREGILMSNCWATRSDPPDKRYFLDPEKQGSGQDTAYLSLRDPHNLPHVSFFHQTVGDDEGRNGRSYGILGGHNDPPKNQYVNKIHEWHSTLPYDTEMDIDPRYHYQEDRWTWHPTWTAKIAAVGRDEWTHAGKPFSFGLVDLRDGVIEKTIPYRKAEEGDFHHTVILEPHELEKIDEGTHEYFWIDDEGIPQAMNGFSPGIRGRIKDQIEPAPKTGAIKPHDHHDIEDEAQLKRHMLRKHVDQGDGELADAIHGLSHEDRKQFHEEDHDFFSEFGWDQGDIPEFDDDEKPSKGPSWAPPKKKTAEDYVRDVEPGPKREGDDFDYDTRWFHDGLNKDVLDTVKQLTDSYPVTKGWFKGIRVSDAGPMPCVVPGDRRIWLPPSYLDKPGTTLPPRKGINHLIAHEFGHALHASIQSHECGEDSVPDASMDDLLHSLKDQSVRDDHLKMMTHPDSPATWALQSAKSRYPGESASSYAEKDDLERFAEGMADHWTSPNPANQSSHIGGMIDFLYHKNGKGWKSREEKTATWMDLRKLLAQRVQTISKTASSATGKLIIYPSNGRRSVQLNVEVATDANSIKQGLMYRPMLPMMNGMVFLYPYPPSYSGFWMKNTLIPLSIAFWDRAGVIIEILDMEPCPTGTNCPVYKCRSPYWGAVEVNKGFFQQWGIKPGDRIELNQ